MRRQKQLACHRKLAAIKQNTLTLSRLSGQPTRVAVEQQRVVEPVEIERSKKKNEAT